MAGCATVPQQRCPLSAIGTEAPGSSFAEAGPSVGLAKLRIRCRLAKENARYAMMRNGR